MRDQFRTPRDRRRQTSATRPICLLLSVMVSSLLVAFPAQAQRVVGSLVDGQSGRPVTGLVALTDTTGVVVDISTAAGAFELQAPEAGDYLVVARATGYRPGLDGIVELADDGFLEVTYYMMPRPIELPGLTATAERQRIERYLDMQGFYERQKLGSGYFITPEELEERSPRSTFDLFRAIPGIDVQHQSTVCSSLTRSNPNGEPHLPVVYVDGARAHFDRLGDNQQPTVDIDAVVGIENVTAVEVYARPSQVPIQYGGLEKGCVILIWTKH